MNRNVISSERRPELCAGDALERDELARAIDALMAAPPRPRASIIVVGDDAVFAITPPARSDLG